MLDVKAFIQISYLSINYFLCLSALSLFELFEKLKMPYVESGLQVARIGLRFSFHIAGLRQLVHSCWLL